MPITLPARLTGRYSGLEDLAKLPHLHSFELSGVSSPDIIENLAIFSGRKELLGLSVDSYQPVNLVCTGIESLHLTTLVLACFDMEFKEISNLLKLTASTLVSLEFRACVVR